MRDPAPLPVFGDTDETAQTSHRVPIVVRGLQTALAAAFAIYLGWMLYDKGEPSTTRDLWLFTAILLLSAALMAAKAIASKADRRAWSLLAVGTVIWAAADIVYTAFVAVQVPIPYPSIADWMYLAFYPCAYIGLALLLLRRLHRPPLNLWLDGLIVALGAAAYVWLAAPNIYSQIDGSPAAMFMSAASPVSDLVLLCMLIGLLSVMGWRASRMWWLLLSGCAVLWITDTAWLLEIGTQSYAVGALLDIGWPLAFALIGLAAWQKESAEVEAPVELRAAVAPLIIVVLSFTLLVIATRTPIPTVPIVLAASAILVGGFRVAQVFRQATVQSETHRQAHTDELTGLANRRQMDQRLAEALDGLNATQQSPCALLLLDVDSFKEINDTLGHAAGDLVLQHVGPLLTAQVRAGDTVARLGGDEFAILLGPGTNLAGAVAVAERIRRQVGEPVRIAGVVLTVSVSIGIAMCPDHAGTRDELLRAADSAMYRAKRSKSGHCVYEASEDVSERGRLVLISELRSAINRGELVCDFQPKISLATGEVAGVEALVRWRHPTDGLLYPGAFLPVAEQAGLMGLINDRVMLIALAQAARWQGEDLPCNVAVNMTMSCMVDPGLPSRISDLLRRLSIPASMLSLEVTETSLVSDPGKALEVLADLRGIGIKISIDDYGTGYSSLAQLSRLKANELKLDETLVVGVSHRPDVRSIVHATVELAHSLGIQMVAEGVESAEDFAELQSLGCDFAQGYYICPPGPPAEIGVWLRNWTDGLKAEPEEAAVPEPRDGTSLDAVESSTDELAAAKARRRLRAV